MAIEQRLPLVNGDDGIWGDDLNTFLGKEHYNADATLTPGTSTNGGHETITVRPGTTVAGTAPLKFTSGSLMTAAEAGAVEFLTDKLYFTQTTSTTRKVIAMGDTNITVSTSAPGSPVTGDLWIDTN